MLLVTVTAADGTTATARLEMAEQGNVISVEARYDQAEFDAARYD